MSKTIATIEGWANEDTRENTVTVFRAPLRMNGRVAIFNPDAYNLQGESDYPVRITVERNPLPRPLDLDEGPRWLPPEAVQLVRQAYDIVNEQPLHNVHHVSKPDAEKCNEAGGKVYALLHDALEQCRQQP